jgi:hypothetical protein
VDPVPGRHRILFAKRPEAGSLGGVSAVPLEVKAIVAVALVLSVARAFLGVPARRAHDRLARTLVGLSICLYVLAGEALLENEDGMAAAFVICGVEALCLAAWVARRRNDDDGWDDGGGGGGGPDDEPPTPIDWDAFDHARDGWRPREPAA